MSTPDVAPSPRPSRSAQRRNQRSRRRTRRVLISLGVVVVLLGSSFGGAALLIHNVVGRNLTTIPAATAFPDEKGRPKAASGSQNILLLGSDTRKPADERDLKDTGGRSDVIMLVHVSSDRSKVSVMSVMRDLYVPVPGHGSAKVNAALAWGGTALTVQTLEGLLGARIDHIAIIDFEGLAAMTTALGGVTVENSVPFTASRGDDRFFPAGPITLEGDRALTFVRERYAFPTGDFQRVVNQQKLLKGILARALSRNVLAEPAALTSFATETSKNLTVDSDFTLGAMGALALSLNGLDNSDIGFFTMPNAGTATSPGGQSIVKVDAEATDRLKKALQDDTVVEYQASLTKPAS
jgi:LCP family protein required for cell wall assembly